MPHFVRCIEGHVFDTTTSATCPICGAKVEIASVAAEPAAQPELAKSPPATIAALANGAPTLWVIGGLGLGLALFGAAAVIWYRAGPTLPTPATVAALVTTQKTDKPEVKKPADADAIAANDSPPTPGPSNVAAPSAGPQSGPANSQVADLPPPAAPPQTPANAPSDALANTAPLPAPTPAAGAPAVAGSQQADLQSSAAPAQEETAAAAPASPSSASSSQQADLNSASAPASSDVNPPPVATGPIDGETFKAQIQDTLDKLAALAPIQSDIANIATGMVGLNLFDHGEEQAGLEMLQQAAASNVPFAAAALGEHYFFGTKTLRRDYEQALRWFDVASLADVPVANYELAVMNVRGLGMRRDFKLAGHYFLAAYHGGFPSAAQIVTNARAGRRPERELLHRMGLDPVGLGMTVLQYYDARRNTDPAGALSAIRQLAGGLQWPAPYILAMAQWDGDGGTPDRASAVKNFLIAARSGSFGALIPVAQASLDGSLGAPNPAQAALIADLARNSKTQSAADLDKLNRIYKEAMDKASPDQLAQLQRFAGLLGQVAPAGSQASASVEPASGNP